MSETFSEFKMRATGLCAGLCVLTAPTAVSQAADDVLNLLDGAYRHIDYVYEKSYVTFSVKQKVLDDLTEQAEDASFDGWDGYGAASAKPESVSLAKGVIDRLPHNFPLPEVAILPDGIVQLEWIKANDKRFVINVHETSKAFGYAWVDGNQSGAGIANYNGGRIPFNMLAEIQRL